MSATNYSNTMQRTVSCLLRQPHIRSIAPVVANRSLLLAAISLSWIALPPTARAQDANTAYGESALSYNTTGDDNSAFGFFALWQNKDGSDNTATGAGALAVNVSGSRNTANGSLALQSTKASDNTAVGYAALRFDTTGSYNTAVGSQALYSVTDGIGNVADGDSALRSNQNGWYNVATGSEALFNANGDYNTALGGRALYTNATGTKNTAVGYTALYNSTGNNNIALGMEAGLNLTTGSNNIIIGAAVFGNSADANVTRIGKTTQKKAFIGGIYNKTVASGVGVIVNSSGQLGTVQSSARYKDDIKPMDKASEALLALTPVTFRYKEELDPEHIPQFGLIAEEVEKINPDLVVRDEDGNVNSVRYEAVNAMLLNEFLKAHREMQELKAIVAQQRKQIETLVAGLQKVNNELKPNKRRPKLVANH
jgi:hypothetical protein